MRANSETLHKTGAIVLRSVIDIARTERLATCARAALAEHPENVVPIFNADAGPGGGANDNRRTQLTVKDARGSLRGCEGLVASLSSAFLLAAEAAGATSLRVGDVAVLQSLPGCARQSPHYDYSIESLIDIAKTCPAEMPLGCVLALERDTRIHVWGIAGRNDVYGAHPATTTLVANQGDAIVFRGDCKHAGSEYNEQNLRVHAYLQRSDGAGFARDVTFFQ